MIGGRNGLMRALMVVLRLSFEKTYGVRPDAVLSPDMRVTLYPGV